MATPTCNECGGPLKLAERTVPQDGTSCLNCRTSTDHSHSAIPPIPLTESNQSKAVRFDYSKLAEIGSDLAPVPTDRLRNRNNSSRPAPGRTSEVLDLPAPLRQSKSSSPKSKPRSTQQSQKISSDASHLMPVTRQKSRLDCPPKNTMRESIPANAGLPAPLPRKGIADLPSPIRGNRPMDNVHKPVQNNEVTNLPRPTTTLDSMDSLPVPVRDSMDSLPVPVHDSMDSLPVPVRDSMDSLPVPVRRNDSLDDLLEPVRRNDSLDDLLEPVRSIDTVSSLPTPVGFSQQANLPSPVREGSSGDLPTPVSQHNAHWHGSVLDLGDTNDPFGGILDLGDPLGGGLDLGSPDDPLDGLDLDSPINSNWNSSTTPPPTLTQDPDFNDELDLVGAGLDLDDELGISKESHNNSLDLRDGFNLDLGVGLDLGEGHRSSEFSDNNTGEPREKGDLNLDIGLAMPCDSEPVATNNVVTFGPPQQLAQSTTNDSSYINRDIEDDDAVLDLEDQPLDAVAAKRVTRATATNTEDANSRSKTKRQLNHRQKMGIVALGVVVIGSATFYGFQQYQDDQEIQRSIHQQTISAQQNLASQAIGHWDDAIADAKKILGSDPNNSDAYSILAQALYASVIDEGKDIESRLQLGQDAINKMRQTGGNTPQVPLAEGLHALATGQHEESITQLSSSIAQHQQNLVAHLYLGWAYAARADHSNAIISFDSALAISGPNVTAFYGKANSLLALERNKEANDAYLQVVSLYRNKFKKDHLGAIVGIAQLAKIEKFGDRENRYLEILARDDIDSQNPYAVSRVMSLAGDEARFANRLSVASERYNNAIKIMPSTLLPVVGLAAISFAKNNVDDALAKLERVLALAPDHLDATLLYVEVLHSQKDMDRAAEHLASLYEAEPKIIQKRALAKMELLRGRLLATEPANALQAEEAYQAAFAISTDGGIEASLALAELYNRLDRPDDAKAALLPLHKKAENNVALSIKLGVTYLGASDAPNAIWAFRKALSKESSHTEARYQLGRSLAINDQKDEAIKELKHAYQDSGHREDIGLELADLYRKLERKEDADVLYDEILESEAPSRNARSKAGAYFARMGKVQKAAEIGSQLLKDDKNDPAGHFLIGQALFAANNYADARDAYRTATKGNAVAQYFDALGRAHFKLGEFGEAIKAYRNAIARDPNDIEPRLGLVQLRNARKEYSLVVKELEIPRKLDPNRIEIYYYAGLANIGIRRNQQAIQELAQATALNPRRAEIYYHIGRANDAMGRSKKAANAYTRATQIAEKNAQIDESWVTECYRLLGYALRDSGGSKSTQLAAFESYVHRISVDNPQTKEVKAILVPLRARQ